MNDTSQFREDMREIYIFTNIGTSELCWDISGLFLDQSCPIDFTNVILFEMNMIRMNSSEGWNNVFWWQNNNSDVFDVYNASDSPKC